MSEGPFGRSLMGKVGKEEKGLCHVHSRGLIQAIPKGGEVSEPGGTISMSFDLC